MHHHAHAPRPAPPPHMRPAAHHLNAPPAPPPHMNTAPPASATGASIHHARTANHHQQVNTQLQKLRQQHQLINNNNNNNNNASKNNYPLPYNHAPHMPPPQQPPSVQPPQPQQQQPPQQPPHMSIGPQMQMQRLLPHQQRHHLLQSQQAMLAARMKPPQQQPLPPNSLKNNNNNSNNHNANKNSNSSSNNNVINSNQQSVSTLSPKAPGITPLHYFPTNNNNHGKFNNNGGGGGVSSAQTPKTIMQNPARPLKRAHTSAINNITVSTTATVPKSTEATTITTKAADNNSNSNNVVIVTEEPMSLESTPVATSPTSEMASATAPTTESQSDVEMNNDEANKENIEQPQPSSSTNANTTSSIAESSQEKSVTLLSNVDSSVPKNSKEKTPMCLVNELARFNKIIHQYRLTSETGPAHSKVFCVTLTLGDEEYSAEGFKIKKAQHTAAAEAIERTKYKHPLPKLIRRGDSEVSTIRTNITPTVELNALAMKLGQPTYYLLDPPHLSHPSPEAVRPPPDAMPFGPPTAPPGPPGAHMMPPHVQHPHPRMMDPNFMRRNGGYLPPPHMPPHMAQPRYGRPFMSRYRYPLLPPPPPGPPGVHNGIVHRPPHMGGPYSMGGVPCRVTLVVGKQKFIGIGRTQQQAKHDAAGRALQVLKNQATHQLNDLMNTSLEESDSKSPISLVHEIGIKRSMPVAFKVLRETGPAHMKNFVTACVVGNIVTEGEGNGKKLSKKNAAEKMLEELEKLPPLPKPKSPVRRAKTKITDKTLKGPLTDGNSPNGKEGGLERRKRTGASIKEKSETDADENNPITRLIQLQQNRKEKDPVFELITRSGNENPRRREFIMEVAVQGMVARGKGNSKKLAKRNAAYNMLVAMGVEINPDNENSPDKKLTKPAAKSGVNEANTEGTSAEKSNGQDVKAMGNQGIPLVSTPAGQLPGILILRQNKKHAAKKKEFAAANIMESTKKIQTQTTVPDKTLPVAENASSSEEPVTVDQKSEPNKIEPANATAAETTTSATIITATTTTSSESSDSASSVDTTVNNLTTTKPESIAASIETTTTTATANSENTTTASKVDPVGNAAKTDCIASSSATVSSNVSQPSQTSTKTAVNSSSTSGGGVQMKDHLLYLAKILGFEVGFADYPKGNHSDFLTIVTLATDPPQICHGVGNSCEESQNDASRNALKILSELGLNRTAK